MLLDNLGTRWLVVDFHGAESSPGGSMSKNALFAKGDGLLTAMLASAK